MKSYEINIDIAKLLHYSDSIKSYIDNKTLLMIIKSFSLYVRDLYLSMIEEEIYSRRYKGNWEPVEDEEYLKYIDTTPSSHILILIKDAIEIREIRNNIVIRIEPSYKYPGSSLSLLKVLSAIDNGTSKFNARPILKSIVRQINSELSTLWKSYLKKKGVA